MFAGNEAAWYSLFISIAFKSTLLLSLACLMAFLLRKRSAATRHMVWTAAAAGVLLLPLLSMFLPALQLPAPASGINFQVSATAAPGPEATRVPGSHHAGASFSPSSWHFRWRIGLMLLWASGAAVSLASMLAACAAMWRVRRSTRHFPDQGLCAELSDTLGIRRAVGVRETESGSMPMTFGMLRSTVFMPSSARDWSEERRRIVLLHELAHVRRGDVITHLLARTAAAVYWWNPLAWIALRELLKERERAADDVVLNLGTRASEYASHLLEVARTMNPCRATRSVAIAMARPAQLEIRLAAILDPSINRKTPSRASAFAAAFLAVAMIAPLAAVRAQDTKSATIPADVDAAIRSAIAQKNHEVLDNAAKAAEQLRKFDTAQQLLQSAAEIRADVSGRQSVDYGMGLLKLGDLESKRNLRDSAEEFYSRAAKILGDRPEAARALMYLGTSAVLRKDYLKALDYLQRIQRIDPVHSGDAVMWMAVVQMLEKETAEADNLFKNAVSLQNAKSPEAIVTMKVYAQFLRSQGRKDEADDLDARATAAQNANAQLAAPGNGVYRIGGGVTPPKILQKVEPGYSEVARAAGLQGMVAVSTEVGPDGFARNFRILKRLGLGLEDKAIEAISQWQFQPGTKDGQPVTVIATIEVNFRLR